MDKQVPSSMMDKLGASIIDVAIILVISVPFVGFFEDSTTWKFFAVGLCFTYNIVFLFANDNRCIGMLIAGTQWERQYSIWRFLIWVVLYTASFATLLWWVWFPFDLLLINLFVLQLPSVIFTKTTFDGLVTGRMTTIVIKDSNK